MLLTRVLRFFWLPHLFLFSKPRKIPLEIAVTEDKLPMYSVTTEDDGRGYASTKLPFQVKSAWSTITLAR